MKKSPVRLYAERLLFEKQLSAFLCGDYAYSKKRATWHKGKYWICNHWVTKKSEKRFYLNGVVYYRYFICKQWE